MVICFAFTFYADIISHRLHTYGRSKFVCVFSGDSVDSSADDAKVDPEDKQDAAAGDAAAEKTESVDVENTESQESADDVVDEPEATPDAADESETTPDAAITSDAKQKDSDMTSDSEAPAADTTDEKQADETVSGDQSSQDEKPAEVDDVNIELNGSKADDAVNSEAAENANADEEESTGPEQTQGGDAKPVECDDVKVHGDTDANKTVPRENGTTEAEIAEQTSEENGQNVDQTPATANHVESTDSKLNQSADTAKVHQTTSNAEGNTHQITAEVHHHAAADASGSQGNVDQSAGGVVSAAARRVEVREEVETVVEGQAGAISSITFSQSSAAGRLFNAELWSNWEEKLV